MRIVTTRIDYSSAGNSLVAVTDDNQDITLGLLVSSPERAEYTLSLVEPILNGVEYRDLDMLKEWALITTMMILNKRM